MSEEGTARSAWRRRKLTATSTANDRSISKQRSGCRKSVKVVWLVSVYGCWAKKSPKNGLDQARPRLRRFRLFTYFTSSVASHLASKHSPKASLAIFIYAFEVCQNSLSKCLL